MERMKVLAVGAHPDDIEIYMFGALAAWAGAGAALEFAIATDGARGGTADAAELASKIPGALNLAGRTTLPQLVALLER